MRISSKVTPAGSFGADVVRRRCTMQYHLKKESRYRRDSAWLEVGAGLPSSCMNLARMRLRLTAVLHW